MIEFPITLTSGGSVCLPGRAYALALGYTKNRGVYRLAVTASGEWEGLAIRCFWHVPDGKDPESSLVVDGYVAVPASVTAQPGSGCITFEGSDGAKVMTSADLRYRVSANSGTEDGTEPEPGTPAWQQLVDAVHADATAAEQAKTDAQTAAQQAGASAKKALQALSDTITAKEDALKAIGDKQTTATQAVDTARDKALKQVKASTEAAQAAANEAATSAGSASQSAAKSSAAASNANASAENAARAQVTASQLAGQAADSASEAQNSATKAAASQQAAESNAAAAQGSATKADASASTAVQGQQRAEAAATRAETAQQQTESASTDALDKISSTKTDALKALDTKQTAATTAVESAQGKALDAVTDAQDTATQAVQAEQASATTAVKKAGAEVLTSIPEDYQTTVQKVKELDAQKVETDEAISAVKVRQNILTSSETGNPISVDDAFAAPLCGLTVYGKSTQAGTPTPDAPVPIVSAGDSGSVAVTLSDGNGKTQTLTLPTPNGLPGIPVISGGNYTDSTGQQWVCDEVDLERGVKVQRIGKAEITSTYRPIASMNQWNTVGLDKVQPFRLDAIHLIPRSTVICTALPRVVDGSAWNRTYECIGGVGTPEALLDFYIANERLGTTAETTRNDAVKALVSWLETNPFSFIYALATPIETPLTPDEIAAYKALTTYGPDTVVQAGDGAGGQAGVSEGCEHRN